MMIATITRRIVLWKQVVLHIIIWEDGILTTKVSSVLMYRISASFIDDEEISKESLALLSDDDGDDDDDDNYDDDYDDDRQAIEADNNTYSLLIDLAAALMEVEQQP